MNSIVVNYRIAGDISKDRFREIIDGCYSTKYKVILNLYDFSISKIAESYHLSNNPNISYIKRDFEEIENSEQIMLDNLIKYGDALAFCILSENNVLNNLDSIDFEWLQNPTNGFIYFDYNINSIRCFLRSKGPNIQLNVPVLFWSISKLIDHISDKDKFNIITNNYAGLHIAKNLCTVYQNDK